MGSFPETNNEFSMVYSFIAIVKLLFIGNCWKQPFLGMFVLKVTISLFLNLKKMFPLLFLSLSPSTAGGADSVYRETTKAFIFSLRNKEQLGPFKSMVKEPSNAIYNHMYMGSTFGRTDIRMDTRAVVDSSSSHLGTSYFAPNEVKDNSTILAGANRFDPDELEVFYLE